MATSSCARQPSFSLLAARARLSLEHIEYLYSKRLGSRSLISKVTCWGPVGGCCWHCLRLLGHIVSLVCPLFTLTENSVFWSARHAQRRDGYGQTPEITQQTDRLCASAVAANLPHRKGSRISGWYVELLLAEEGREDKGEESHLCLGSGC